MSFLEDFDDEEVRNSELDFIVRDRKLWITCTGSEVHNDATCNITTVVGNTIKAASALKIAPNIDLKKSLKMSHHFTAALRRQ